MFSAAQPGYSLLERIRLRRIKNGATDCFYVDFTKHIHVFRPAGARRRIGSDRCVSIIESLICFYKHSLNIRQMKVILVHGIFDTGHIFKHMISKLEANEHECYAPNLKPSDARLGIADLSIKLKQYIDQKTGVEQPIAIIGFSMGCMVSRYYLQLLEGHTRTKAFFAISGPHNGTLTAYFYIGKGARDMRPHSSFLSDLAATESALENIDLYTYRTPFDAMIIPSKSSNWKIAKNIQTKSLVHSFMIRDRGVVSDIVSNLHRIEAK